jgi:hypothetical protein
MALCWLLAPQGICWVLLYEVISSTDDAGYCQFLSLGQQKRFEVFRCERHQVELPSSIEEALRVDNALLCHHPLAYPVQIALVPVDSPWRDATRSNLVTIELLAFGEGVCELAAAESDDVTTARDHDLAGAPDEGVGGLAW